MAAESGPRPRAGAAPPDTPPIADMIPAEEAAEITGITVAGLEDAAAGGVLPPWLADADPERGWVFSGSVTADEARQSVYAGVVWVPNLPEDAAAASVAWTETLPDPPAARRVLMHWFRAAVPDPMEAAAGMFLWWCNHAQAPGADGPPTAEEKASRWSVVSAWYDAMTESGIGHSQPHLGTEVRAALTDYDPDSGDQEPV